MLNCLSGKLLKGSRLVADSCAGGIAITFDDAYINEWYSLKALLDAYRVKVTFFVSHFDCLTEESLSKLKILRDDGHEIGFHGLRHLNAAKFAEEDSVDNYLAIEILPGIERMRERGFNPTSFSYPYGARTPQVDAALLKHFKYVRGTAFTRAKKRIVDLDCVYYKGRGKKVIYGVGVDTIYQNSIEEIQEGLKRAMKKKEILIVYAHRASDGAEDYCISPAKLEAIVKYASENNLEFYRVSDL